jgi:hypothetical protein
MPCFSSQTLSAAKSSSFVRAKVPGACRDSSFGVGATAFDGLFGLRPTFRRPGRGAEALAASGIPRGGSGGEMSLEAFESTVQTTPGTRLVEVVRSGRLVAIPASNRIPDFM